jgi:demethylmenaquinone methyltransferase/2-methoxy-6-polyprenyl-1,4-benzoquinol methylase
MSSFAFMKVLESSAHRYDRGVRWLSRGRIDRIYSTVSDLAASPELRILDIGCGTGGVAIACATLGAHVVGIDLNADMLEIARSKPLPFGATGTVEWIQIGIAEIEDRFESSSFDAVTACLVLSELSSDERTYALEAAYSCLRPGGRIVLADEAAPNSATRRAIHMLGRLPLAVVARILTQTTTRAVTGLVDMLRQTGFEEAEEQRPWPAFAIVSARTPLEAA